MLKCERIEFSCNAEHAFVRSSKHRIEKPQSAYVMSSGEHNVRIIFMRFCHNSNVTNEWFRWKFDFNFEVNGQWAEKYLLETIWFKHRFNWNICRICCFGLNNCVFGLPVRTWMKWQLYKPMVNMYHFCKFNGPSLNVVSKYLQIVKNIKCECDSWGLWHVHHIYKYYKLYNQFDETLNLQQPIYILFRFFLWKYYLAMVHCNLTKFHIVDRWRSL